jgi:phage terminase large subunit GpA-like protein
MEVTTHPTGLDNLENAFRESFQYFRPPKDVTVSEWAIENRIMPKGTTSRPGPFRPEVFQIEMMNAILDPLVHEIVVQKCTQMGYSDAVLNNILGYYIDADPKPIMFVQPTVDDAKKYGKIRITPMIDACPALKSQIKDRVSRRAGNTLALKEFPGGFLKLTGANSGAGLRSDPVPIVLFDEIDAYPLDVDGEGDPIAIGERRTDAFSDYKIFKGSTPAKPKGVSPIEKAFEKSDQRRFFVPCPHCGKMQTLRWRDEEIVNGQRVLGEYRLAYQMDDDNQLVPNSVFYICASCKKGIPERFKQQMLNRGTWIATYPGRPIVGFHLNALYSNWRENWNQLAIEWHEAQRDPEKLKAFINLRLGETWEEDRDAVDQNALKQRRENYGEGVDVPAGVGLLTAAVDVQGDRLECVVKGWGDREESWLIAYQQFFGDPGQADVWNEVDEFLLTRFTHASGAFVTIKATMIDSGGAHTDEVYRFVKARQARRVWAIKGSSESGKEILGRFSMNNAYRVKLWSLGTDTAKDRIFARMKIAAPGPGYMHLPEWAEEEYMAQLTGEKAVRRYKKGRGAVREYVKTRPRNEALDLEVYALAALYSLGSQTIRDLKARAEVLSAGSGGVEPPPPAPRTRGVRNAGIA